MIIATPSSTTARCWSILARTAWLKSSTKVFPPVAISGWPMASMRGRSAPRSAMAAALSYPSPLRGPRRAKLALEVGEQERAGVGVFKINRTFRQLRPPPDSLARSRCEASAFLFSKGRRPKVAYAPSRRFRGGGIRKMHRYMR